MASLFFRPKKKLTAVLDIRDGSVGGMLISGNGNTDIPEKLWSVRRELPFQKSFSYRRLFYATAQAISSVASGMQRSGHGSPDEVICIVGPHFHISQTRIVKYKFDRPTKITENFIKKISDADLREFEEKHIKNILSHADYPNIIFERKIMQVKLNGYETEKPVGKIAEDVAVSIYVSLIPKVVMDDLTRAVKRNFHTDKISFHSFSFAVFDSLRGKDCDRSGFIYIDVENELTEAVMVKNGIIEESASFPSGKNHILREIGDGSPAFHEGAESLFKLYNSRSMDSGQSGKIEAVIKRVRAEWTEQLKDALKKISAHHLLPEGVFIIAGSDCRGIFYDFMKEMDLAALLVLNKAPAVKCLGEEFFADFCRNKSACPDDIYFLSEAVFVHRNSSSF